MAQYINKDALVAEIERLRMNYGRVFNEYDAGFSEGRSSAFDEVLSFLNTLEVKEIHEDIDMDLNHLFEEMGVEPDSRIALMFKNAFYKSVDNYLDKKEDKL